MEYENWHTLTRPGALIPGGPGGDGAGAEAELLGDCFVVEDVLVFFLPNWTFALVLPFMVVVVVVSSEVAALTLDLVTCEIFRLVPAIDRLSVALGDANGLSQGADGAIGKSMRPLNSSAGWAAFFIV